mmetsp:Transcript_11831/g.11476  ORF Transcript_11831/g.11476 Transcript_11831/m.11476 type:complete len:117 (-) Transcript_11831:261-611(-)
MLSNLISSFIKLGSNVCKPVSSHLLTISAGMKYISNARAKRQPLTTKRAGKGFYKGNGARKEGHLNSKAHFIRDRLLCTELVVPNLKKCNFLPYIATGVKRNIKETVVNINAQGIV